MTRSTSYHGCGLAARALLVVIADRYNGSNNGSIALGVREAAYELGCSHSTAKRATRQVDDRNLARPTAVGAWRGRHATEWRLTWKRCDKTGDLPRNDWPMRTPYVQLLLPKPKKEPMSGAERARQYRERKRTVTGFEVPEANPEGAKTDDGLGWQLAGAKWNANRMQTYTLVSGGSACWCSEPRMMVSPRDDGQPTALSGATGSPAANGPS